MSAEERKQYNYDQKVNGCIFKPLCIHKNGLWALLSYSLIMWVCLCITLAVFYIRIKVNVMRITLQNCNEAGN